MAGMVATWAEERFGPREKEARAFFEEIVARLERIESPRVPRTQREIDILQALENDQLTGEKLAAKAGYSYDGYFKQILSSLKSRGMIDNKRTGYFIPTNSRTVPPKD